MIRHSRPRPALLLALCVCLPCLGAAPATRPAGFRLAHADGFRGIWYSVQPTNDALRYKYSGGMATYPQQISPQAVYVEKVNKTFFVYGGTDERNSTLLHCVSYFDHATGKVARPRILLDKKTTDAHDNPCLAIDDAGHLLIFSNSHGAGRPSYIHRGVEPCSIDAFEKVLETNFSYGKAWFVPGGGFLFLHTHYEKGVRNLFWMTSPDGRQWSKPHPLARLPSGQYQISWLHDKTVATAFNYHPGGDLNARTNLYYLQTDDAGETWRTAGGRIVKTPLVDVKNPALVYDYNADGLLVYLKDIQFDEDGKPVLLYLTSKGHAPGATSGDRTFHTARWTGSTWAINDGPTTDHNYDHGSLYIERGAAGRPAWRLIAPTDPGPQPGGTGGEMVVWTSNDAGKTWKRTRSLTHNSRYNQSYLRRPLYAHAGFYALWADGDPLAISPSHLYFTDQQAEQVWRLPEKVAADQAAPEPWPPSP